ncbi:MAG: putative MAPEG superfamily protein [Cognaticolwellia sp.]|jgi:uncharacterized MAPEG superfamily protein
MTVSTYVGPVVVTLAYILLYYGFVVHVGVMKARRARVYKEKGEPYDRYFTPDREMLAADRMQLNTLEQMPPFLVLLWLNAVFVGPMGATIAGGVYVLARAAYPLALGKRMGRGVRAMVLASTVPGYLVILYFMGALSWALIDVLT